MAKQKGKKDITQQQKNEVAQFLLQHHRNAKLQRGGLKDAAAKFDHSLRSICAIWKQVKQQLESGGLVYLGAPKKTGSKHRAKLQLDRTKIISLSVLERLSIRKMAAKLGVGKSTLERWIKLKFIRAHTSAIKPALTQANKLARLKFNLRYLNPIQTGQGKLTFQLMHNIIYIDEKWFYMTKTSDRYYLLPGEREPYRSTQSKRFITKIMFMCVVGRPTFSEDVTCIFYGKIGLFPFATKQPAQRSSKNRQKRTMETKPIHSITKDVIKSCIIERIIPAIKAKWPKDHTRNIIIQQDNAKLHINTSNSDFIAVACSEGFSMKMINQSPNSLDTNVNDLGFFRMIQSLQDDKPAKIVDGLLQNVMSSYEELTPHKLNHVFITLQSCFVETLRVKGRNNYKIPYMNKKRLETMGQLPISIEVEENLVKDTIQYLQFPENESGSSYDIAYLVNLYR